GAFAFLLEELVSKEQHGSGIGHTQIETLCQLALRLYHTRRDALALQRQEIATDGKNEGKGWRLSDIFQAFQKAFVKYPPVKKCYALIYVMKHFRKIVENDGWDKKSNTMSVEYAGYARDFLALFEKFYKDQNGYDTCSQKAKKYINLSKTLT